MGVQPAPPTHTLLAHDQPAAQPALQSMEPPQPLPNLPPQYCPPVGVQLSGVQAPLGTHWPDWQTSPLTQSPQASDPPQPSPMLPQYFREPTPH
jgi:hypothetical protein